MDKEKARTERNAIAIGKMIEHIDKLKNRVGDKSRIEFITDDVLVDVCAFHLLQLGEQANKVREDFRNIYPSIPWKKMRDLRNIIAHDYEGFDSEIAWLIIANELDELRENLQDILDKEAKHG